MPTIKKSIIYKIIYFSDAALVNPLTSFCAEMITDNVTIQKFAVCIITEYCDLHNLFDPPLESALTENRE